MAPALAATDQKAEPSALEKDPEGLDRHALGRRAGARRLDAPGRSPPDGELNPKSQWSLDKATGHLVCQGDGGHEWLRLDQVLTDLHLPRRVAVHPRPGQEGVQLRRLRPEFVRRQDVAPGPVRRRLGRLPVRRDLRELRHEAVQPQEETREQRVKPAGEWNTYEFTCKGRRRHPLGQRRRDQPVERPCQVPGATSALEAEGWRIEFRNVKVKLLLSAKGSRPRCVSQASGPSSPGERTGSAWRPPTGSPARVPGSSSPIAIEARGQRRPWD